MALKGDSQAAELDRLRLASQVGPVETMSKAQEILRLMGSKCRQGALGRGDLCRTAIAFDLACRALACPVPHKTAVKLSGLESEAVYVAALGTAQRLLGLKQRYTCEEIAKSVGGKRVGVMAASELKRYKERFLASYPARQATSIDLDGTVYAVAAFYLCAKKLKHPVDKQRLLDLSLVREAEFTAVCRSMLDLCYSTLGISVSDKPSADRLAQFEKAAALGKGNKSIASEPPSSASFSAPAPAPAAAAGAASAPRTSSSGSRHRKGDAGSGERRRIPLSSASGRGGLAAPRSHIAHLAMSIQAASQRKRYGGMTVAPAEPGGSNEANDSLHDRTHRPKRQRRPLPVPATPAACNAAAAAAAAPPPSEAAPRAAVPRSAVIHNPYTARTPASARPASAPPGRAATGDRQSSGGGERRAAAGAHVEPSPRGRSPGRATETAGTGMGWQGERQGRGREQRQQPEGHGQGQGYAEWKERVLASMENRIRGDGDPSSCPSSCSPAASGAGPTNPDVAGAAHTSAEDDYVSATPAGDGSSRTPVSAASPAPVAGAKTAKQASLTSFFTQTD